MLIFRLILRHINRRRSQSALFVLGVALGVAVGVAIDLANASASRAFDLSTESITGRTTHQIIGGPNGLPETLYTETIRDLAPQSAPVITAYVRAPLLNEQPLRLLGVDPVAEAPFRDYLSADIAALDGADIAALDTLWRTSGGGIIGAQLAERYDISVGDALTIRANAEQHDITILGIIPADDTLNDQALDDLLLVHLVTAQDLLEIPERVTRIDLILPEDADLGPIESALPPSATLTTPDQQAGALAQMTDAFEVNLQALSLLALVVGVFLIYNTVMFSVVQRRHVLGIMRSLGTSRRQIFVLVVGESLLLGTIGTLAGLGLGVLMGQGTVDAVSQTVNDLYFRVNVQGVTVPPRTLLTGAAVGVFASLSAAILPAIDATRTTPAGSMRRSDLERDALRLIPYITGLGLLLIVAGVAVLQIPTTNLIVSFTALFLVVVGAALFTPLGMILLMKAITPLSGRLFGLLGRMGPRSVVRSMSRTAVAVAALTLAISVIVGVGVMISSFRSTVVDWLDLTLGADVYISTPDLSTDSAPNLDPALQTRAATAEGVERVTVVRSADVVAPDYPDLPPVEINAIDVDISGGERRFAWTTVSNDEDYRERIAAGQVMVSESFAFQREITREDNTITLLTANGPQEFTVFGAFYDYTSDQGTVMMDLGVYRAAFDDPFITSLGVFLAEGYSASEVIANLRNGPLSGEDLEIQSFGELRDGALEVFDRTFSITVALQLLATVVAFIGILSALMALQLENAREYGILRANGMTPGQIRKLTLIQTGLMGLSAGLMAIPIGLALAYILIYVINVRSFGWTMAVTLPPEEFIEAMSVAVIAALLAGLYPAWRVSRMKTAEAIRAD